MALPADHAPDAARLEQGEGDGDRPHSDEVPGSGVGELLLEEEEDDRSDDRALEGSEPSHQHHEDHVCRPLDSKNRLRLDEECVREDEGSSRTAAEPGKDEDAEL